MNTLIDPQKCTFNLGAGEFRRARKLICALQLITRRLNDRQSALSINNAQHKIDKTWTHWGEGSICKRTPVIHHHVCEVQALKTTRPTILLESQGLVLGS